MYPQYLLIFLTLLRFISFANAEIEDKSHISKDNGSDVTKNFDLLENILRFPWKNLKHFRNDAEENGFDVLKGFYNFNNDPVGKMVMKITAEGTSTRDQVDAIVAYITKVIKQEIRDSIQMAPDEITIGTSHYACMAEGVASGLKKIKYGSTSVAETGDSLHVNISYELSGIHIKYPLFYINTWPLSPVTGFLDIDIGEIEIEVGFNLPKSATLVDRLLRDQCVVKLWTFRVKNLDYRSVSLTDGKDESYDTVASVLDTFVKMNRSLLENMFRFQSLQEVRRCLRTAESVVCDENLTGASLKDPDSEEYKSHCGSGAKPSV